MEGRAEATARLVRQPEVADADGDLSDVVPYVGHSVVRGEAERLKMMAGG